METQYYHELLKAVEVQDLGAMHFKIIDEQILFQDENGQFVITTISAEKDYNEHHFELLPEMAPYQLIEGKIIFMYSPTDNHQRISGNLFYFIKDYLMKNPIGEVRYSPLDVRLDEKNVVQPDILFVFIRRTSIIEKKIMGAPDFIIEILSTHRRDTLQCISTMGLYGRFLVQEYWIVHPEEHWIEVYHNKAGILWKKQTARVGDTINSKAIEGFCLDVARG
ncbi:MAG: Uma2 family endonuclease [Leptospiraceae bacterium]|nr:Uma2 family endonuclease [Leptospiraceae bacterium]MCP5503045.1 Uma2 family endonuclease [Leptospiraceae bacterium]